MLVGDPGNTVASKVPSGNCFRCEDNFQQNPFQGAPCTNKDTKGFPKGKCNGGWRVTVTFPSCWDGKNTDSPDHKSHIAYPASGTFESGGACPKTHPVKIPQVMYEIMYDTTPFHKDWPTDGKQPFYWSHGDDTGHGIHGDYLFGWKGDALQKAMDTKCANDNCKALERQSDAKAIACTKGQFAKEEIGDQCKWLSVCQSLSSHQANRICRARESPRGGAIVVIAKSNSSLMVAPFETVPVCRMGQSEFWPRGWLGNKCW